MIQVVRDGNGEIVIAKEIRVGEVCPVSVGRINVSTTMRWRSGDCVIGAVGETIDIRGIEISNVQLHPPE
jgi:hypothetical protein